MVKIDAKFEFNNNMVITIQYWKINGVRYYNLLYDEEK